MAPITNGSSNPIGSPQTVLDVSDALGGLTRPLTVTPLTKTVVDFGNSEAGSDIETDGVLGPLSGRSLYLKPEGQRAWSWKQLLVRRSIGLAVDDRAEIDGIPYRVKLVNDYSDYGYFEYHLIEDYTGDSGGNTVPASRAYQEVYFDGSTVTVQENVSAQVPDATVAVWTLYAPDNTPIEGAVSPISTTQVQITINPAPVAGTYRLVGVA